MELVRLQAFPAQFDLVWRKSESFVCDQEQTAQLDVALKKIGSAAQVLLIMIVIKNWQFFIDNLVNA